MARLACCGFEWSDLSAVSQDFSALDAGGFMTTPLPSPGFCCFSSAKVRSGQKALAVRAGGADRSGIRVTGTWSWVASTTYFFRCYFCFSELPGAGVNMPIMAPGSRIDGTPPAEVRITSGGALQLWDSGSGVQIGSNWAGTVAADSATWYRVEMSVTLNASAQVTSAALHVNGTAVASGSIGTPFAPPTAAVQCGWFSVDSTDPMAFLDDIAVNDSTGANENTWPGDGNIVTLVPQSDSARGVNWTGGAGGTANLWQAVRNQPPAGVVLPGTDLSEVKNAASDATGNYDAACVSYAVAGVAPSATVKLVMGTWATGCGVTNGVSGAVRLASNPAAAAETAITPVTVPATYPSGWTRYPATAAQVASQVVYGDISAGNRSTGPVLRIGKRQNSTRVLVCCAMGAHVECTGLVQRQTGFTTAVGQAVTNAATW